MKYPVGKEVVCNKGIVVENYKLAGDICIGWENGMQSSYDEDWLDENLSKGD